jgi:hypothetical protein
MTLRTHIAVDGSKWVGPVQVVPAPLTTQQVDALLTVRDLLASYDRPLTPGGNIRTGVSPFILATLRQRGMVTFRTVMPRRGGIVTPDLTLTDAGRAACARAVVIR